MVDAAFLALSVITIGSAIAALEFRSMIYGSMALMGTLGGIAGFFLLLLAVYCDVSNRSICWFYRCSNLVYCHACKKRIDLQKN